jgi:adenylate cyclase
VRNDAETDSVAELPPDLAPMSDRWVGILSGESILAFPQRAGRRLFGLLPSPWRCKFCNAPFRGPYAGTMKRIGYTPSSKNPQICARCIEHAPEGGAIVPVTVLFADVRGYTALCEQMAPAEVSAFVNRFYQTASSALLAHEGLFVPGLAGSHYRKKAVEAARTLVRAVRYSDSPGGTLEVGIGIASGREFVGNVAGGGYKDFAAVGDVTNTAARLTSAAANGQIVVDAETYADVRRAYPDAGQERLTLKGKQEPVEAYWIPP